MSDDARAKDAPGPWRVTPEDVALIARGAGVLGSGGGGDTYLGQLLAHDAIRRGPDIAIVAPESLVDDALVIAVAQMGTATVFAERLAQGQECALAFDTLERYLGKRAAAVMCYEIGGINSMLPFVVAAQRGLPVVNADLMGRAFPELQMTTLDMYGAPTVPIVVCDDRGNVTIVVAAEHKFWIERLARALTIAMGGLAYVARPILRAADLTEMALGGSYSRARAIGAALCQLASSQAQVETALMAQGARLMLRGMITGVERRTMGRVTRGTAMVQGRDASANGSYSIEFQNENLMLRRGANILVTVPDIICVLDEESSDVVTTEALSAGSRVAVIAFPADDKLRTPAALQLVGPSAFDYNATYRQLI